MNMMSHRVSTGMTLVLWVVLSLIWLNAAVQKPLWNDEFYTQVASVRGQSYGGMLLGKIDEGNTAPLFYMLQKVTQDILNFQTPAAWINGHWSHQEPNASVVLRFWPVLCMSAGVAVIFYFFATRFHLWAGLLSVVISMTSYMVWDHAFEARPYALWFLLTALEATVLYSVLVFEGQRRDQWARALIILHWLLSLTVIFSVISTMAAAVTLWTRGYRRISFYWTGCILPALVSIYYYAQAPKYQFWLAESFMKLLGAALPVDRMAMLGVGLVVWACCLYWIRQKSNVRIEKSLWQAWGGMLLWTTLILAGCVMVLLKFKWGESADHQGFQVANRYFLVLSPIGIIMTTLCAFWVVTLAKGTWRIMTWGLVICLIGFRVLKASGLWSMLMGVLSVG